VAQRFTAAIQSTATEPRRVATPEPNQRSLKRMSRDFTAVALSAPLDRRPSHTTPPPAAVEERPFRAASTATQKWGFSPRFPPTTFRIHRVPHFSRPLREVGLYPVSMKYQFCPMSSFWVAQRFTAAIQRPAPRSDAQPNQRRVKRMSRDSPLPDERTTSPPPTAVEERPFRAASTATQKWGFSPRFPRTTFRIHRVPHFSRSLREVGLYPESTKNQFIPVTLGSTS
jgi:hypothetical protein